MKLYVGNLHYQTSEQEVKEYFESIGEVNSTKIVVDRNTARSKGFGFVEMSDEETGRQAIEKLNGTEFMGRTIVVSEARPRPRREF
ncbi:MAG: RNA recognition motif domain-containing protein [Flavobacteriales bacterium AspAUS03]